MAPPPLLTEARKILSMLQDSDLIHLMFCGDAASQRLQKAAYYCPPGFHPDLPRENLDFIKARIKCNSEMMKVVLDICSPLVQTDVSQNARSYPSYVV